MTTNRPTGRGTHRPRGKTTPASTAGSFTTHAHADPGLEITDPFGAAMEPEEYAAAMGQPATAAPMPAASDFGYAPIDLGTVTDEHGNLTQPLVMLDERGSKTSVIAPQGISAPHDGAWVPATASEYSQAKTSLYEAMAAPPVYPVEMVKANPGQSFHTGDGQWSRACPECGSVITAESIGDLSSAMAVHSTSAHGIDSDEHVAEVLAEGAQIDGYRLDADGAAATFHGPAGDLARVRVPSDAFDRLKAAQRDPDPLAEARAEAAAEERYAAAGDPPPTRVQRWREDYTKRFAECATVEALDQEWHMAMSPENISWDGERPAADQEAEIRVAGVAFQARRAELEQEVRTAPAIRGGVQPDGTWRPYWTVEPRVRDTMLAQIGTGNVMFACGGPRWVKPLEDGVELPNANGTHKVRVHLHPNDTYVVERIFVRNGAKVRRGLEDPKEFLHGRRENVYAEDLGELVARASAFESYDRDEW